MIRMKKAWLMNLLLLPAVFLGVLSTVAAAPATDEAPPRTLHADNLRGAITAIDDAGFSLDTGDGTVDVAIADTTRFHIIGQTEVGLADFAVGDEVVVGGTFDDAGVMQARRVAAVPEGEMVTGRVTDLTDYGFNLQTPEETTVAVSVTDDTYLAAVGRGVTTWGEHGDLLREGVVLAAFGDLSDDGASLAAHTLIGRARQQPPRPGLRGIIVSLDEDSFELQLRNEMVITVNVTDETNYFVAGVEEATLADFAAGDAVLVRGERSGEGTMTARLVAKRPPGELHAGVIDAINGPVIMMTAVNGDSLTVVTTDDTVFRRGREIISLDDLAVGDQILVRGETNGNSGQLMADQVVARPEN